jgi:hypothetical protein
MGFDKEHNRKEFGLCNIGFPPKKSLKSLNVVLLGKGGI